MGAGETPLLRVEGVHGAQAGGGEDGVRLHGLDRPGGLQVGHELRGLGLIQLAVRLDHAGAERGLTQLLHGDAGLLRGLAPGVRAALRVGVGGGLLVGDDEGVVAVGVRVLDLRRRQGRGGGRAGCRCGGGVAGGGRERGGRGQGPAGEDGAGHKGADAAAGAAGWGGLHGISSEFGVTGCGRPRGSGRGDWDHGKVTIPSRRGPGSKSGGWSRHLWRIRQPSLADGHGRAQRRPSFGPRRPRRRRRALPAEVRGAVGSAVGWSPLPDSNRRPAVYKAAALAS